MYNVKERDQNVIWTILDNKLFITSYTWFLSLILIIYS